MFLNYFVFFYFIFIFVFLEVEKKYKIHCYFYGVNYFSSVTGQAEKIVSKFFLASFIASSRLFLCPPRGLIKLDF